MMTDLRETLRDDIHAAAPICIGGCLVMTAAESASPAAETLLLLKARNVYDSLVEQATLALAAYRQAQLHG